MNVYIYGTGSGAQKFVDNIKNYMDKVNILAYVDTNKEKIGTLVNNKLVIGLDELTCTEEYDYLFIATEFIEVYFKVLKKGIPERKIVLVYSKIINDLHTVLLKNNIMFNKFIHNDYVDYDNEFKLRYNNNKSLDVYLASDYNAESKKINLLLNSECNFNVLGLINTDNLKIIHEKQYDYILLLSDDCKKYYELLANGVTFDSIVPTKSEIINNLYNNEIEKRNLTEIIYKMSKTPFKVYPLKSYYEKIRFEKESDPLVSIVIPVFNNWKYTYNCLYSILHNTEGIKYEIIIADDNSIDETKNIDKYIDNITVVRNNKQLGFLKNCNKASLRCKGKYITFLNNDTCVQINWMNSLIKTIEADNKIGIVGSKLVYPNGKLQQAGKVILKSGDTYEYGKFDDPDKPEYNYVKEVDYLTGTSIIIKKHLWKEIRGFDERFSPGYYEDADLAFEVRKRGYKVIYQPQSAVIHFGGITYDENIISIIKEYKFINRGKFVLKWESDFENKCVGSKKEIFIARDRSQNKKVMIIVDQNVPEIDKDAGSKNIYSYIKVLLSMNIKIIFIGDNFEKMEPYTSILQQDGVEVLYGSYYHKFWNEWVEDNKNYIDLVLIHRPNIAIKYIDYFKESTNIKIVYHVADLHFLREYREYELTGSINALEKSKYFEEIEKKIIQKANTVITLSSVEKKIIIEKYENKNVEIMPILCYEKITNKNTDILSRKDLIFVGGFRHKPNIDAVIWFINDIFPIIKCELPDIKFHIVGSNPTKEIIEFEREDIIIHGFVSDDELTDLYSKSKISIIPLRFGAGVKGKTIEAMYNNIQIVSTSIGIEGIEGIKEYIKATDSAEDFAREVIYLYKNNKAINANLKKYRDYISSYSSYDSVIKKFLKIINE